MTLTHGPITDSQNSFQVVVVNEGHVTIWSPLHRSMLELTWSRSESMAYLRHSLSRYILTVRAEDPGTLNAYI